MRIMYLIRCKYCESVFGLTSRKQRCKCKRIGGKQLSFETIEVEGPCIVFEFPERLVTLNTYTDQAKAVLDNVEEGVLKWTVGKPYLQDLLDQMQDTT